VTTPSIGTAAWLVARKDLLIELRTRTAFLSSVVFSMLGLAIFYFAWSPSAVSSVDLAPGVIWVIFTLSGIIAVQRSFGVEQPERAGDGLLVSPIDREAIYLGKAIANMFFIGAVEAIAIPVAVLFYNLPFGESVPLLFAIAALATVGLVSVGTLFASMAINTRMAELLLPMLSLPFFMPIVMAAATVTSRVLAGRPMSESAPWIKLLIAFDVVFLTACTLAFPYTLEE
jgi:heme exporter protein B